MTQKTYFTACLWKPAPAFNRLINNNPMQQIMLGAQTHVEHKLQLEMFTTGKLLNVTLLRI